MLHQLNEHIQAGAAGWFTGYGIMWLYSQWLIDRMHWIDPRV